MEFCDDVSLSLSLSVSVFVSVSLSQTRCPERPSAAAHQGDADEVAAGTGSYMDTCVVTL